MKLLSSFVLVVFTWLFTTSPIPALGADNNGVLAWWRFESVDNQMVKLASSNDDDDEEPTTKVIQVVHDELSDAKDELVGFHTLVPGVSGNALRFGGIGTYIVRTDEAAPHIAGPFTIEAWIAIGAYPVHWCPIIAQMDEDRGIFFGVDAYGHLGFKLAINGTWVSVASLERIRLGKWAHVACTYRPDERMKIYLDGKLVGEQDVAGDLVSAADKDMLIGNHPLQRQPLGTIRSFGTAKVNTYFDGLLDELKIYSRVLDPVESDATYEELRPAEPPQLPERRLPAGPAGPGRFGAYYTTLKYYDAWDAQWRVGDSADIVVRFDTNPCRFVFWRGTSYIPHWVTENGIWYDNEFNETWSAHGCHEPMSDKQCRHSQVRVIESSDARVVVHWRYALVDNWYEFARVDPATGWGDWTDEIYTVYPDGVGVRKIVLHSTNPRAPHEWHEGIIVMGPGQRPEDVLEPGALTMMNIQGQSHTYSWRDGAPGAPTEPSEANIQIINTKSKFKPFIAVTSESKPEFDIYDGELRRDVSMFPWWNHWPTAFDPCDGRYAMDADRASHSSLTHCHWEAYDQTENSMTKIMLNGLIDLSPRQTVQLVKSWDSPPKMSLIGDGFSAQGYDPVQRAYIVRRTIAEEPAELKLRIDASEASPIANVAIVLENWNASNAVVSVDGQLTTARTGHRTSLDGSDLVVWIEHEATAPTSVVIRSGR